MKILIVEDELPARQRLLDLLEKMHVDCVIIALTTSVSETVQWLLHNDHPDLILMDIELTDGQAFEIFNQVKVKSMIIFITAYDNYVLKAFHLHSINYLLKPITQEDLQFSLRKFLEQRELIIHKESVSKVVDQLSIASKPGIKKIFIVKQGQRLIPVHTDRIAYFFFEERNAFVVQVDKSRYLIDYIMEDLESVLDPNRFTRVNRSFIVNRNAIALVQRTINNRLALAVSPEFQKQIIISREKIKTFLEWWKNSKEDNCL